MIELAGAFILGVMAAVALFCLLFGPFLPRL